MKKILLVLTTLLLTFGLAACFDGGDDVPELTSLLFSGVADAEIEVGDAFNVLEGISVLGDDDGNYTDLIVIDSETCDITDAGDVTTTVAKVCVIDFSVVVEGKFKKASMTLTITPKEIIVVDAPTVISWDFEDAADLDGWEIYTAGTGALEMSIDNGAMKLVTEPGGQRYETRLDYMGVPLENGYDYKVSFRAKADVDGKKVHLNFGELLPAAPYFTPFKPEGFDIITLTTGWVEYSYTFSMELDNQNGGPLFEMGDMEGSLGIDATIWVDDFKIEGGSGEDNAAPTISGADDIIIEVGDTFSATTGVTAMDLVDGDVTSSLTTTGTVNTSANGVYTVTYNVTDAAGNAASVERTVVVAAFQLDPSNNDYLNEIFLTDTVIGDDLASEWYKSVSWGNPIFTAETVGGKLVMSSAKDGALDFGTSFWDHIVRNTKMTLVNGATYKIVFDGMTDEAGVTGNNMMVKVEAGSFAAETQAMVTATGNTVEFMFHYDGVTTTAGSFLFFVGGREHVITVENLMVYTTPEGANTDTDPELMTTDALVKAGEEVVLMDLVTASDVEDGALVATYTVVGPNAETEFDNTIAGEWMITFSATDSDGNTTTATAKVTILAGYSFMDTVWVAWYGDEWSGATSSVVTIVDGELVVDVIYEGTPATYATQVYQEGFAVEMGKFYRITFDARADEAKDILVAFGDALDADPWFTDFAVKTTVSLTTDMVTYVIEFEMTEPTTADQGKLVFELATAVNTKVYLDNIMIEEITALAGDVVADTNMVLDGTFEDTVEDIDFDTSAWVAWLGDEWSGATTSIVTVINGELVVDVVYEGTPQTYATQVYQEGFAVEMGKFYRITFDARADEAKDILVAFGDALDADPWFTDYNPKATVSLTTEMQRFVLEFEMTEATTTDQGKLVFELATAVNTKVYIDNVRFEEITALLGDAVEGTEQVIQGEFEVDPDFVEPLVCEDGFHVENDECVVDVVEPDWMGYGTFTVTEDTGFVTIGYSGITANWWESNAQYKIAEFDGTKDAVQFTFTGVAGHEYLFKIEGGGVNTELGMVADGTEQMLELDLIGFTAEQRAGLNLVIVFVKTEAAEGTLALNDFVYVQNHDDTPAYIGYGAHVVTVNDGSATIDYTDTPTNWWEANTQYVIDAFDGTNDAVKFTFTGTAGHTYLFKIEGGGNFVELPIEADGTEQELILPLTNFTEAQRNGLNLIIIFVQTPASTGTITVNDFAYTVAPSLYDYINDTNNDALDAIFDTDTVLGTVDTEAWYMSTGWGAPIFTAETVGGVMTIVHTKDGELDFGSNFWDDIVRFQNLILVNGAHYKVVFDGATSIVGNTGNSMLLKIEGGGAFKEVFLPLSDTTDTYSFEFVWEGPTVNNGLLLFMVGGVEHTLTLSNVNVLIDSTDAAIPNVPSMSGVKSQKLDSGTTIDLLTGVTAFDVEDGDITPVVTVLGPNGETVYDGSDGLWTITYTATDSDMNEIVQVAQIVLGTYEATTIIANGTFDGEDLTGWVATANALNLGASWGEANMTYSDVGANQWDVKLEAQDLVFENGVTYVVMFDARSNADRQFALSIYDVTASTTVHNSGAIDITAAGNADWGWTRGFMTVFTYNSDNNSTLEFQVGNFGEGNSAGTQFDIDNVVIYKLVETTVE